LSHPFPRTTPSRYLFNPENAEQVAPIVFSPAKIQRARERNAEMEAQKQAEEAANNKKRLRGN